jgi:hypothetical protein
VVVDEVTPAVEVELDVALAACVDVLATELAADPGVLPAARVDVLVAEAPQPETAALTNASAAARFADCPIAPGSLSDPRGVGRPPSPPADA